MRYAAWRRVSSGDAPPVDLPRAAATRAWAAERLAALGGRTAWLSADECAPLLATYGVTVAPAADGTELTVEVHRDDSFGALVRIALGDTSPEAIPDEVHLLAPAAPSDVARALRSLRSWPVLDGRSERGGLDLHALESLLVSVACLGADLPQLARLELGPVFAGADGVRCTDARMLIAPAESPDMGFPRRLRSS
jgi:hypothetical protein